MRRYVAWLKGRGLKAATVARHLNSLRSLWNYLRESGYTEADPFFRLSLFGRPEQVPPHLTAQEAAALLCAAERQRCIFNGFRDVAVLSVLLYSGVRRGELLNLRLWDVDLRGPERLAGVAPGAHDLYSLQRMLGHSRLDTTAGYLHATVEDLRQALSAHPLCNGDGGAP